MANTGSIRYPRGFIVNDPHIYVQSFVDGDPVLSALYADWRRGEPDTLGWVFKAQVLKAAKRLIGDPATFLRTQAENPSVYGYNYEFLLDTVSYLATGHRRVSIQNWEGLVTEHRAPSREALNSKVLPALKDLRMVGDDFASVVSVWCGYPQGFIDLLKTLNLCFGRTYDREHAPAAIRSLLN